MMKHLAKQCGLAEERVPIVLDEFGNCGGASVAVTLTQALADRPPRNVKAMMIGYGVGLSWGAVITDIDPGALILHATYTGAVPRA
jgi:3-oxoacyl-[acyl-carrier-protein] synthase-3